MLSKALNIKTFSTGEFSRYLLQATKTHDHSIFNEEELIEIDGKMKRGELLSDSIVNRIIKPQLIESRSKGLILDGYPRTLEQAKYLDDQIKIDVLFNLTLREDVLVHKLLGRRVCPCCNNAYNVVGVHDHEYDMPPLLPKKSENKCDDCDKELVQRADDTEEVITRRQRIYQDSVKDILNHYDKKGLLCQFEPKRGIQDFDKMLETVSNFVNRQKF